jgi:hypothetical protein
MHVLHLNITWLIVAFFCTVSGEVGDCICKTLIGWHIKCEQLPPKVKPLIQYSVADLSVKSLPSVLVIQMHFGAIRCDLKDMAHFDAIKYPIGKDRSAVSAATTIRHLAFYSSDHPTADEFVIEVALDDGKFREEISEAVIDYYIIKYESKGLPVVLSLFDPTNPYNARRVFQAVREHAGPVELAAAKLLFERNKKQMDDGLRQELATWLEERKQKLSLEPPKPAPLRAGAKDVVAER